MRAIVFTLLLLLTSLAAAQTSEEWQADLLEFDRLLQRWHPNPHHTLSRESYSDLLLMLQSELDSLSNHERLLEFTKLAAAVGDAHTYLDWSESGSLSPKRYPVKLRFVEEELVIWSADSSKRELAGLVVDSINGRSVKDACAAILPYVNRDNEFTARFLMPKFLTAEPFVTLVIPDTEELGLRLVCRKGPGARITAIFPEAFAKPEVNWLPPSGFIHSLPLVLRDPETSFWMELLREDRLLYVQINSCEDAENESLEEFTDRIALELLKPDVRKVAIDFRNNTGGNSRLLLPLVKLLAATPAVSKAGNLFVLTGPASISAAVVAIVWLRDWTEAILVGKPTGSSPNQYGDNRFFELPNTKLSISIATEYFQTAGPYDRSSFISPDIYAPLRIQSLLQGEDAAIEAVHSYETRQVFASQFETLLDSSGFAAVFTSVNSFLSSPENRYADVENELRRFAGLLIGKRQFGNARVLLSRALEHYPHSARFHAQLADIAAQEQKFAAARRHLSDARQALPDDPSLYRSLRLRVEDYIHELEMSLSDAKD